MAFLAWQREDGANIFRSNLRDVIYDWSFQLILVNCRRLKKPTIWRCWSFPTKVWSNCKRELKNSKLRELNRKTSSSNYINTNHSIFFLPGAVFLLVSHLRLSQRQMTQLKDDRNQFIDITLYQQQHNALLNTYSPVSLFTLCNVTMVEPFV